MNQQELEEMVRLAYRIRNSKEEPAEGMIRFQDSQGGIHDISR
jgi:hypothetical protein